MTPIIRAGASGSAGGEFAGERALSKIGGRRIKEGCGGSYVGIEREASFGGESSMMASFSISLLPIRFMPCRRREEK